MPVNRSKTKRGVFTCTLLPENPLNFELGFEVNATRCGRGIANIENNFTLSALQGRNTRDQPQQLIQSGAVHGDTTSHKSNDCCSSDSVLTTTVHTPPADMDDLVDIIFLTGTGEIQPAGAAEQDRDLVSYLENWDDASDIDPQCHPSAVIVVDDSPGQKRFPQSQSMSMGCTGMTMVDETSVQQAFPQIKCKSAGRADVIVIDENSNQQIFPQLHPKSTDCPDIMVDKIVQQVFPHIQSNSSDSADETVMGERQTPPQTQPKSTECPDRIVVDEMPVPQTSPHTQPKSTECPDWIVVDEMPVPQTPPQTQSRPTDCPDRIVVDEMPVPQTQSRPTDCPDRIVVDEMSVPQDEMSLPQTQSRPMDCPDRIVVDEMSVPQTPPQTRPKSTDCPDRIVVDETAVLQTFPQIPSRPMDCPDRIVVDETAVLQTFPQIPSRPMDCLDRIVVDEMPAQQTFPQVQDVSTECSDWIVVDETAVLQTFPQIKPKLSEDSDIVTVDEMPIQWKVPQMQSRPTECPDMITVDEMLIQLSFPQTQSESLDRADVMDQKPSQQNIQQIQLKSTDMIMADKTSAQKAFTQTQSTSVDCADVAVMDDMGTQQTFPQVQSKSATCLTVAVVDEVPVQQTFFEVQSKSVESLAVTTVDEVTVQQTFPEMQSELAQTTDVSQSTNTEPQTVSRDSTRSLCEDHRMNVSDVHSDPPANESESCASFHPAQSGTGVDHEAAQSVADKNTLVCFDSAAKPAGTVNKSRPPVTLNVDSTAARIMMKDPVIRLVRVDETGCGGVAPEASKAAKNHRRKSGSSKKSNGVKERQFVCFTKNTSIDTLACNETDSGVSLEHSNQPKGSETASEDEVLESQVPCVSSKKKPTKPVTKPRSAKPSTDSKDKLAKKSTMVRVVRVNGCEDRDPTPDEVAEAAEELDRKNAAKTRKSVLKRKAYIESIEKELEESSDKIKDLQRQLMLAEQERDSSKEEVKFLRTALLNQGQLTEVLKKFVTTSNTSMSCCRKRALDSELCSTPSKRKCLSDNRSKRHSYSECHEGMADACCQGDDDSLSVTCCCCSAKTNIQVSD